MAVILTTGLLAVGACAGAAYWMVVIVRLIRLSRGRHTIRAGLEAPVPEGGWPLLTVIVPAHNEQRVIDACLRSIRDQVYPQLEVIVVLDRCSDRTAEIVGRHAGADPRVRVLEVRDCPDGWNGKCNAARVGAEAAAGRWLLFADADTRFHPDLARAGVALAHARRLGLLSLLSTLTCERWHERTDQPVASLVLAKMFPLEQVNRDQDRRVFANGQFLLFDRVWYERLGGHDAVHTALLEDLAFARALRAAGGRGGVVFADGMFVCSMYENAEAFARGWKRILLEACNRKSSRMRKHAWRLLLWGLGSTLAQVLSAVAAIAMAWAGWWLPAVALGVIAGAGLLAYVVAVIWIYRLAGAPWTAVVRFPLGCWRVAGLMLQAARDLDQRRPVVWGGREYVLEPR